VHTLPSVDIHLGPIYRPSRPNNPPHGWPPSWAPRHAVVPSRCKQTQISLCSSRSSRRRFVISHSDSFPSSRTAIDAYKRNFDFCFSFLIATVHDQPYRRPHARRTSATANASHNSSHPCSCVLLRYTRIQMCSPSIDMHNTQPVGSKHPQLQLDSTRAAADWSSSEYAHLQLIVRVASILTRVE
jgi:hypothetical protein